MDWHELNEINEVLSCSVQTVRRRKALSELDHCRDFSGNACYSVVWICKAPVIHEIETTKAVPRRRKFNFTHALNEQIHIFSLKLLSFFKLFHSRLNIQLW